MVVEPKQRSSAKGLNVKMENSYELKTSHSMKMKSYYPTTTLLIFVLAGLAASVCAEDLTAEAKEAKTQFLSKDESLKATLGKASGYAIFPSVAKGALGVGAAAGKGQVYEAGNEKPVGEVKLKQVTIGFQAGGQAYAELILFEDKTSLDNFKKGNFEFSAQVSAVAVTAGASANAKYEHGVMVLTMAKGGLMYEASVGGQKFKYKAY
jgi:lipid-binding SYLF domain-containing protein